MAGPASAFPNDLLPKMMNFLSRLLDTASNSLRQWTYSRRVAVIAENGHVRPSVASQSKGLAANGRRDSNEWGDLMRVELTNARFV